MINWYRKFIGSRYAPRECATALPHTCMWLNAQANSTGTHTRTHTRRYAQTTSEMLHEAAGVCFAWVGDWLLALSARMHFSAFWVSIFSVNRCVCSYECELQKTIKATRRRQSNGVLVQCGGVSLGLVPFMKTHSAMQPVPKRHCHHCRYRMNRNPQFILSRSG